MKIKIFTGCNPKKIERCINRFIEDKCVLKVLQTESFNDCIWSITITIMYDDLYNCEYLKCKFKKTL